MPDIDTSRRMLLGSLMLGSLGSSVPLAGQASGAMGGARPVSRPDGVLLVTDHGALGDGKADDHAAIMQAIAAAHERGGGTILFPHVGPWLVSAPIELQDNIVLAGVAQDTIVKRSGAAQSTPSGGDSIIHASGKTRFRIEKLTLVGTRRAGTNPTRGCHGLFLEGCAYFDIENTRVDYCDQGYRFRQCYTFGVAQATALRCTSYGYALFDGCTSFVLRNTTSWACGGGWSIAGSSYGSLIGCACDLSDAGGKPGDPFGDSGGNYRRPAFIFDLSGSKGISIIAPGSENCNSAWLYCEGTQATILNPYIYGMEAHSPDWHLIQLRGTDSYSNVTIVNPFGFDSVRNVAGAPTAILIENPKLQHLYLSGRWRVNAFEGPRAYPPDGMILEGSTAPLDYTQTMMVPGATRFLASGASDIAAVTTRGNRKWLTFENRGGGVFSLPIAGDGLFHLKLKGTCSIAGGGTIAFARVDAQTMMPRSWRLGPTEVAIDEWIYLPPVAARDTAFRITLQLGARMELEELVLLHVGGQR